MSKFLVYYHGAADEPDFAMAYATSSETYRLRWIDADQHQTDYVSGVKSSEFTQVEPPEIPEPKLESGFYRRKVPGSIMKEFYIKLPDNSWLRWSEVRFKWEAVNESLVKLRELEEWKA